MTTAAQARQGLVDLTTLSRRELFDLWATLMPLRRDHLRSALEAALVDLGNQYGAAAAALAADWYDELRDAAGVSGSFTARPAELADEARWASLVTWGTAPLFRDEPDPKAALTLISGGMQRTIADAHRLTIVESTQADPQAVGWRRVGDGKNCGFCQMLIGRGHVYTESSVTFRSHDHCNCAAAPSFDPDAVTVSGEPFRQSQRRRSAATKAKDNARAADYIAEHYSE